MNGHKSRAQKALLTAGFLSVTLAISVAYLNPAMGYEADIYMETPLTFWVGFGFSISVATILMFTMEKRFERQLTIGLAGISFMSFILLPIFRGWFEVLGSDSYSHRGTTISLLEGEIAMTDFLYPSLHTISLFIHHVIDIPVGQNFHLIVSIFVLIFIIFVVLVVRILLPTYWSVPIALISGMLLISLNHVSGHLHFQPSSQAMLLLPLIFYFLIRLVLEKSVRFSCLLIISMGVFLLLHPQHAANLLLLIVGFSILQILQKLYNKEKQVQKIIHKESVLLLMLFWLWVQNTAQERFASNFNRIILWFYTDTETAESVQLRAGSLESLGGSLEEMFFKLFFIGLVFSILCGLFMIISLLDLANNRLRPLQKYVNHFRLECEQRNAIIAYWTCGFIFSAGMFVHYFLSGYSDQYFRHYGFLMATVTIIGALALSQITQRVKNRFNRQYASRLVIIGLIILMLISFPVIFPSPYIYQGSDHVTKAELEGHTLTLEHSDDEMRYSSVRRSAHRYIHAVHGTDPTTDRLTDRHRIGSAPSNFASSFQEQDLRNHFTETTYLTVTERNRVDETEVYNGLRWTEEDFEYLNSEPGKDRIINNGDIEVYIVYPNEGSE